MIPPPASPSRSAISNRTSTESCRARSACARSTSWCSACLERSHPRPPVRRDARGADLRLRLLRWAPRCVDLVVIVVLHRARAPRPRSETGCARHARTASLGDRGDEVEPVRALERERVAAARSDVDHERRPPPALVLFAVDVERAPGDLADEHVPGAEEELPLGQADRGAAVTAAPRLHEHERAVAGPEPLDRGERRVGGPDPPGPAPTHRQKSPSGFGS